MKKFIFAFIFMSLAVTIFYSCKKENTNQTVNIEDEMMAHGKKVIALIQQFEAKMNSNLKEGESIELDSAVWNMEALQNYSYAYPDSSTRDFVHVKSYYTIDVDAHNEVLLSDVQDVNSLMEDTLNYQLSSFEETVVCMKFWDVAIDSVVSTTAYLSAVGGFGLNLSGPYYGFDDDDDWYWGTIGQHDLGIPPLGKCDGTEVGVSDGSDELQWRLNNPALQPPQPIYFFTDLETFDTDGFDWEDGGEYLLYVGWDYPEQNCLTNVMLTDYLMNSDEIINTSENEGGLRPDELTFESVFIRDDMWYGGPTHYHLYSVTYGIPSYILPPN